MLEPSLLVIFMSMVDKSGETVDKFNISVDISWGTVDKPSKSVDKP
jgi:hypothetical protein